MLSYFKTPDPFQHMNYASKNDMNKKEGYNECLFVTLYVMRLMVKATSACRVLDK